MIQSSTLSNAIWPSAQRTVNPSHWLIRNATLAIVFSAIIGLLSHIQFKVGITPVPITGQTLGVLLTGALLGPRLGIATIALYIIEGYLGLPVFASLGGAASLGYLFGFVPAAGIVGYFAERRWDRSPLLTALMMTSGSLIIYVCGVSWLMHFVGGFKQALLAGVVPFLPGDVIKASIATALLPTGWYLIGKRPGRDAV
jgi:biotin transport system substrate-specific component